MKIGGTTGKMNPEQMVAAALKTWSMESESVAKLASDIDQESLVRCIRAIGECKGRILLAGVGTSGAAAKKIAHSLCCIERPAHFLSPGDAVHGGLGGVQPHDVVIAISKGGNTREIVNIIPSVKTKNAFLIGVTENGDSTLARQSDLWMKVKVAREPDAFNMLATASTMAVIALFDAVCIALIEYTSYTREQFSVIHPGGAVGERLLSGAS